MSFKAPNKLWFAVDRSSYAEHDASSGVTKFVNQGVEVAHLSPSGSMGVRRAVVADGASVALDASQSGALCVFDKADGGVFTLPPAEAGLSFDFVIAGTPSSGGHRVECATGDFIVGSVLMTDTDTGLETTAAAFNGSSHLAIDMDAATDGWLAGGHFTLTAISTTQWIISGLLIHTGDVASPAAAS